MHNIKINLYLLEAIMTSINMHNYKAFSVFLYLIICILSYHDIAALVEIIRGGESIDTKSQKSFPNENKHM